MAKVCEITGKRPARANPFLTRTSRPLGDSYQTFTSVSGLKHKVSGSRFVFPHVRFVPSTSLVSTRSWRSQLSKQTER